MGVCDEELAREAAAGSSCAFETLVLRYEARLFRFARRWGLSADEAEDATQDAFLSAWKSLGRYDPGRPFGAWLFTILARRASGVSRARRSRLRLIDRVRQISSSEPSEQRRPVEANPEHAGIWSLALSELGSETSSALWLRYVEDLSPKAIGQVLGKSGGAVRVMLHRARQRLLESMDPETIERLRGSQQWDRDAEIEPRLPHAECRA